MIRTGRYPPATGRGDSSGNRRLKFDVEMHGLGNPVTSLDESGSNMSRAGGQQDFAVVLNFLMQSPMANQDCQF